MILQTVPPFSVPLRTVLTAALLMLGACAPKRIPRTDIPDTRDTRAIIDVLGRYRQALEARDAHALLALVSPAYLDDAGTATLEDDMTYEELQRELPQLLAQVRDVRPEVSVRRIDVNGNEARAVFYYTNTYRLGGGPQKPRSDSDLDEMLLRREHGAWKIVKGL